nr:hypothetical protein [Tanacetum cinerariifolium]
TPKWYSAALCKFGGVTAVVMVECGGVGGGGSGCCHGGEAAAAAMV